MEGALTIRLRLLNLWLRLTVKPYLRRLHDPEEFRAKLKRDAERFFVHPPDANYVPATYRGTDERTVDAIWASRGRPYRHRVILYFHGGAYIAGSPATHRHLAAWLAGVADARALVPDYRLAPEHPFPAAVVDGVAAYRHLLEAGYDPGAIAFAGDSAGGGLAFATLHEVGRSSLPLPACIVAFSPWCDMTGTAPSLGRNARWDVMLPAQRLGHVVHDYVQVADPTDPRASPVFSDVETPPPTLILASRREILLDDAHRMADRLRDLGGDVSLELWNNTPHAWPVFAGVLGQADAAIESAGQFLAAHLD